MLFLINTPSFNETLTAIQRSGHGTSDHVLFLIETSPLTEENEVLHGFVNDLFNSGGTPFHAPIGFFNQETNELAIFCYFCPSSKIEFLNAGEKYKWNDLHSMHLKTNSNGYGSLQPRLNISLTLDTSRRIEGNNYQKWMLQFSFFEGGFLVIPISNIYTRGSLITAIDKKLKWMACLNLQHLQSLFGLNSINALDLTSWCILAGLLLLYGFLFKNIWKGLDLFWTLVGKELLHKHDRKSLFILLTALSILSYTYESIVSADSMQLTEFPPFKTLIRKGFRFWLPQMGSFYVVSSSLSNWTKNILRDYFGDEPLDPRYYFAGEGQQSITFYNNDTLGLVKAVAKLKLFITNLAYFHMVKAVGKQMVSVNRNLICKVESVSTGGELSIDYSFRTWGYLSSRCSKLLANLFSSGDYVRVFQLKQFQAENDMKNLQLKKTGQLFEPKPICLTSAVGLCSLSCIVFGFLIFIWWGIAMVKSWRKMVRIKIVYFWQRFVSKPRIPDLKVIKVESIA
ncbi:unnamed protein product [Orchesella dallaii]|uniref:Uncharacterized protein n=1 Tax=Orchesella dallaii TaxID=48710 RepID=A0ABP1RVE6_9HEXA